MLQSTSLLRGKTKILLTVGHSILLQSTSLLRGKTYRLIYRVKEMLLQSTSLLRGKTSANQEIMYMIERFNPLPSCEGRRSRRCIRIRMKCFNPLPSCEGRLRFSSILSLFNTRFNPLPSCEGRQIYYMPFVSLILASIHFPLAREDPNVNRHLILF